MKFNYRILLFYFLFLSGCNQPGETSEGKVIGIKDGDTIEVLINGTPETVRLAEIDCPEKAQPYGKVAKQFTASLCFGKTAKVIPYDDRDQYGRIIGTVYIDDTLVLNKALLKAGLAWHYKHFSDNAEYAQLENTARELKLGLWQGDHPTPPWHWRKKEKNRKADLVE